MSTSILCFPMWNPYQSLWDQDRSKNYCVSQTITVLTRKLQIVERQKKFSCRSCILTANALLLSETYLCWFYCAAEVCLTFKGILIYNVFLFQFFYVAHFQTDSPVFVLCHIIQRVMMLLHGWCCFMVGSRARVPICQHVLRAKHPFSHLSVVTID